MQHAYLYPDVRRSSKGCGAFPCVFGRSTVFFSQLPVVWVNKSLGPHAHREEEDHPKALYRRGTTHALLGNWEEATRDLARPHAGSC